MSPSRISWYFSKVVAQFTIFPSPTKNTWKHEDDHVLPVPSCSGNVCEMTRRCWNENCVWGPITSHTQLHMSTTAYRFAQPNPTHFPYDSGWFTFPITYPKLDIFCSWGVLGEFFFYQKTSLHLPSWGGQDISNLLQVRGSNFVVDFGGDSSWVVYPLQVS